MLLPRLHQPSVIPVADRETWLELRKKTIGASESAALFETVAQVEGGEGGGIVEENDEFDYADEDGSPASPYLSPLSLWALKTGRIAPKKADQRITWGNRLEPIIAAGIAETEGWTMSKPEGFMLHPRIGRMSATLDYEILLPVFDATDEDGNPFDAPEGVQELVPFEIKNVSGFERGKWRNVAGEWIVPDHIMIQVQHQMSVAGARRAVVGVLFGGSEERFFIVPRDEEMISGIEDAVAAMLLMIDQDIEPEPCYATDADIVRRLRAMSDPLLPPVDWSKQDDLRGKVSRWNEISSTISGLKKELEVIKCEVLHRIGDAECASLGDGAMITAKTTTSFIKAVEAHERSCRTLRIGKEKKATGKAAA